MTFTKEDADRIIAEVKANAATLAACDSHLFELAKESLFPDYRCKHCGGVINGSNLHWYMVGRAHGELAAKSKQIT